jgi:hypothetical protein
MLETLVKEQIPGIKPQFGSYQYRNEINCSFPFRPEESSTFPLRQSFVRGLYFFATESTLLSDMFQRTLPV